MFSTLQRRSALLLRNSVIRPRVFDSASSLHQFRSFASKPIIGIDFGGNSSSVAYHDGNTCKVLTNSEGARTTPSVVSYIKNKDGRIEELVGSSGKRQMNTNPKSTFFNFKRLLGRDFNNDETQELITKSNYSFEIKEITNTAENDSKHNIGLFCQITNELKTPEEIASVIMSKMKSTAEGYINDKVSECILTVPPYFTQLQKDALTEACKLAGLRVKGMIDDAQAAALAYNLGQINIDVTKYIQSKNSSDDSKNLSEEPHTKANQGQSTVGKLDKPGTLCAVYDLGGSTFSFTILEMSKTGELVIKAHESSLYLGGNNFDDILVKYICDEFEKDTDCDITNDPMSIQRVREAAERAKIELSHSNQVTINIPFITADATGPKHIDMSLTRAKYEMLSNKLMNDTLPYVNNALKTANITDVTKVKHILLCGGMTRTPKIQDIICKHFKQSVNVVNKKYETMVGDVAYDELQSYGAAIYGYWLNNLSDEAKAERELAGEDGDEDGGVDGVGMDSDAIPLAIGIELMGNQFYKIIDRNTQFPCEIKERFTIAYNGQNEMNIKIWQGNSQTVLLSQIETEIEQEDSNDEESEMSDNDENESDLDEDNDENDENENEMAAKSSSSESSSKSNENKQKEKRTQSQTENENENEFEDDNEEENENSPTTKIEKSHHFLGEFSLNCNTQHNGLITNNICVELTFNIDDDGILSVTANDITEYDRIDSELFGDSSENNGVNNVLFENKTVEIGNVLDNLSKKEISEYLAQSHRLKEKFIGNLDWNLLTMEREYLNNKSDMVLWQNEILLYKYNNYLNENNIQLKNKLINEINHLRQLRNISDNGDIRDKECSVGQFNKQINNVMLLQQQLNDYLLGFSDATQTGSTQNDNENENENMKENEDDYDDNQDDNDNDEYKDKKSDSASKTL